MFKYPTVVAVVAFIKVKSVWDEALCESTPLWSHFYFIHLLFTASYQKCTICHVVQSGTISQIFNWDVDFILFLSQNFILFMQIEKEKLRWIQGRERKDYGSTEKFYWGNIPEKLSKTGTYRVIWGNFELILVKSNTVARLIWQFINHNESHFPSHMRWAFLDLLNNNLYRRTGWLFGSIILLS